jgi:hypothetical protein
VSFQSLPLWVVPEKDEPAHGILLRLSTRNGILSRGLVAELTGLTPFNLRMGIGIDRLASIIQCDPNVIRHSTITEVEAGHQMIRGQRIVTKRDVDRKHRRYCPQCVSESGYHRFWFDLRFVTSCPEHGIELSKRCSCGGNLGWSDVDIVKCRCCTDGHASLVPRAAAHPDVIAMDAWALGRLGAHILTPMPVLDKMSFTAALDTIGRIGMLAINGFQENYLGLKSVEMPIQSVRAHGFRIIQNGGLDEVFDRVYEGFLASGLSEKPSLTRSYGWFMQWFRFNGGPNFSPEIAKILMANASKRFQVHPVAFRNLERPDTATKPLTLSARQLGMCPMTLRSLLEAQGKLGAQRQMGRPIGVDQDTIRELMDQQRDLISFRGVSRLLGLTYCTTRKLREAKEIPVWIPGGQEGRTHEYGVRKRDVEAWVDDLLGTVPALSAQPPDTVTLSRSLGAVHIDILNVIAALRDKRLTVIGCLTGQPRFAGAVVSLEQARSCVPAEIRAKWRAPKKRPKEHSAANTVAQSPSLMPSDCAAAVPGKTTGI